MGKVRLKGMPRGDGKGVVAPINQKPMGLKENATIQLPAMMIPSYRTALALERKAQGNLLINTWGGLGDQVCAEPAIRYALRTFKNLDVSLASEAPQLFQHLTFKRVFNLKEEQPFWEKYFMFRTIHNTDHLQWEFMSHMLCNAVDYVSLCMFRCQMPIVDRTIHLYPKKPTIIGEYIDDLTELQPWALIHAGRHWQTKTFPKPWWDEVLATLIKEGVKPVLLGANTDDNRGTVDVNTDGVFDLRSKTDHNDMIWLTQEAPVLLTNDSSPLHMAASGNAWIGYIATCKHPDYISHWRNPDVDLTNATERKAPIWNWRMQNFGLGGIWDLIDYCPNKESEVKVEDVGAEQLAKWLPDPVVFGRWGAEKAHDRIKELRK